MTNRGLGKGLSALLRDNVPNIEKDDFVKIIDIDQIEESNDQPRKKFEYDKIKELADSIGNTGLLQPIIVSAISDKKYKIIAGERRWLACKIAKLQEVPVMIKDLSNKEILEVALIENIQREELSVIYRRIRRLCPFN